MTALIPNEIRPMLEAYLEAMHAQLPDLLCGFYLYGSVALGAFQPEWSDIDFVAVTARSLSESEILILDAIHQKLIINYDKWKLEGTYFLAEDLGKENLPPRPNFHENKLHLGNFDMNPVNWWILKDRGIVLYGEKPDYPLDWETLIHWMRGNMNSYWKGFLHSPSKIGWLFSDYGIQWLVLGTLRQYYSFQENDITSKMGAGEYGLRKFPQWQRIIQEAMNLRNNKKEALYSNRFARALDARRFLQFILRESNES